MLKENLKTGMRVRTRGNNIYLVVRDVLIQGEKDILFAGEDDGWMDGNSYEDNLVCKGDRDFDVVEVYTIDEKEDAFRYAFMNLKKRHSIWKRQEYTEEQREVFKALKVLGFNWIARDDNANSLMAYDGKPTKKGGYWITDADNIVCDITYDFEFIKWEDEEPFEIPSF